MLDNFREWLSDNLRYILLGLAILVVLVILFFGIKAFTGGSDKKDKKPDKVTEQDKDSDDSKKSDDSSEETQDEPEKDENALEKNAYPEVNSLIEAFYTAWGQKDVSKMKELTDNFDTTDEAKVLNAAYIESYSNINTYTKAGLTEDSYVVFASYDLKFKDIATKAPGLTQLYVMKDSEGKYLIHNDDNDENVQKCIEQAKQDENVKALIADVETRLNEALASDEVLQSFEESLGEEASAAMMADDGATLSAKGSCNVRAEASTEAEIIGQLEAGDKVKKVRNADNDWIEVKYDGQTGYVFGELLE